MSYITLKCKNCGSNMSLNTESHSATCIHCGSTFLITDLLDEKDIAFTEKFTPKNLERKMLAQDALKQGETFLYKAEYDKAEMAFKRAIELDESNYKGYLGVVKSKTQNLNALPENDDYLQYANYALSLAQADDLVVVESELAKLDLLKHEQLRQKKIKSANQKREEQLRKEKHSITKTFTIIAAFILVMFGLFILISSAFSSAVFGNKSSRKTINVDSYESLKRVLSNKKYLNYEINLTDDIDCEYNALPTFGNATNAFTGIFNGNKHKISNASMTSTDNFDYLGIFGHTNLAKINNLILDNVKVTVPTTLFNNSISYCGVLAGKAEATSFHNIEIKNTCSISIQNGITNALAVGGMVGYATKSSSLTNVSCHSVVDVNLTEVIKPADTYIGGVVGICNNSIIQKTCSNGSVTATIDNTSYSTPNSYVGGIAGLIQEASAKDISNIKNNFFSGYVSVTSNRVDCKISSIAGSLTHATTKQNNYCLFTSSNFVYNGIRLSFVNLSDYSYDEYFVELCISNDSYMQHLTPNFIDWQDSTTFTPKLV